MQSHIKREIREIKINGINSGTNAELNKSIIAESNLEISDTNAELDK